MIFYAFGLFGLAWAIGSYSSMPKSVKSFVPASSAAAVCVQMRSR